MEQWFQDLGTRRRSHLHPNWFRKVVDLRLGLLRLTVNSWGGWHLDLPLVSLGRIHCGKVMVFSPLVAKCLAVASWLARRHGRRM